MLTEQRLANCRDVGRDQSITAPALTRAMNTACLFWFLTMMSSLLTFFAVMIPIATIFGHPAVGDPISTVILGLLLGMFVFAASSYWFTIVRSTYLSDGQLTPHGPTWIQRWSIAASKPRPRDSMIGLNAGTIVAVVSPAIMMQM